jgi:hypothetical protein
MQVPYTEELATHSGPESCAGRRKTTGEALTGGVWAGRLSRERNTVQGADIVPGVEGNTARIDRARSVLALRGQRTMARTQACCTGIGRSQGRPGWQAGLVRAANPEGARR